ncbi:Zonular occludens toxin (Zot) [compost metagenome]
MAINAYTGVMGSGKSFEVTANVVLPAIKQGRRIVTNIDGISVEKIHDYLMKKHKGLDREKLGGIVHVTDDDVQKPAFFPDEKKPEVVSVVQAGDLVVIDEAWRHWNKDKKLSPEHMQFFRMHRHYTHPETGVSCDCALIFQSISDVHRSVRSVIELTARTLKIKTLGLARTYRLELFEGDKITKTAMFSRKVMNYDKAIFPLYKSYAGGSAGKEVVVDKRQNVLRNPMIWFVAALLVVIVIAASTFMIKFLRGDFVKRPNGAQASTSITPPSPGAAAVPGTTPVAPGGTPISSRLRVSGEVVIRGERWIVLTDEKGRFRFESPALFVGRGVMMVGNVEGQRIATWTGTLPASQQSRDEANEK